MRFVDLFRKKWLLLIGIPVVVVTTGVILLRGGEADAQYKTAKVERGEITANVSATGKVNAVVTVQVGSQVSGTIQRLFVDFNSRVHKDQIVAQIDPALFQAQVEQARAKMENDQANVEKARVVLADAKRNLGRMAELLSKNLVSQSDKDAAQTAYDSALAGLKAAEAQVMQDHASLKLAETNLRYTTIRSPVDGIVISRNVDVGQTVAASLQAPTLFTIAQDLTEMQIDTSVDEADIGKVRVGQEAEFTVDAYPESPFQGTVHDIYNQPLIVQNVVTYDAIIRVKNPDLKLKPGMTANVTIRVGHSNDTIKLPNAALRFSPEKTPGQEVSTKSEKEKVPQVWILKNGKLVPVSVTLGLNEGSYTEMLSGDLSPGDEVVIEKIRKNGSSQGESRPPRMRF
ncbi:MAG TPA: efflux RND transporter periplasmic adaptor subunit [Nitrospiria bacterium]